MATVTTEQPKQTATQRLASLALGAPLEGFVRERRERGVAWRVIARDLFTATEGLVDVTHETLRSWYSDHEWERAVPQKDSAA